MKWHKTRFSKCDHAKSDTYLKNNKENVSNPRKKASRWGLYKCLLQSHYGRLLNNTIQKQTNRQTNEQKETKREKSGLQPKMKSDLFRNGFEM